jgi:hypothetical protein
MSGHINGLQIKVFNACPLALFIHCYARVLHLVKQQGLVDIIECLFKLNCISIIFFQI